MSTLNQESTCIDFFLLFVLVVIVQKLAIYSKTPMIFFAPCLIKARRKKKKKREKWIEEEEGNIKKLGEWKYNTMIARKWYL